MSQFVSENNLNQILARTRNANPAFTIAFTKDFNNSLTAVTFIPDSSDVGYTQSAILIDTMIVTSADSTVPGYSYKYSLVVDVDEDVTPIVMLNQAEALSGEWASICDTGTIEMNSETYTCVNIYRKSSHLTATDPGELVDKLVLIK